MNSFVSLFQNYVAQGKKCFDASMIQSKITHHIDLTITKETRLVSHLIFVYGNNNSRCLTFYDELRESLQDVTFARNKVTLNSIRMQEDSMEKDRSISFWFLCSVESMKIWTKIKIKSNCCLLRSEIFQDLKIEKCTETSLALWKGRMVHFGDLSITPSNIMLDNNSLSMNYLSLSYFCISRCLKK